jgi:acetoin utilization deacetylase AcuC-like enzyme
VLVLAETSAFDDHKTGAGHPERRGRLEAAVSGIDAAKLWDAVVPLSSRRADEEELFRVHSPDYVRWLSTFCEDGGGQIDLDTVASSGSYETALLACGAVLAVVDALEAGAGEIGFVAARPPGHHATASRAMGFCLLNNVAVAVAALVERGQRVCVLDWDVHHGNGTSDIFWNDPRVLYVSTHEWPLYPGTGRAEERGGPDAIGLTVNIPLPAGTTGDVVRAAFDEIVAPAIESFAPDWVLVSSGFDAHRADPLASLGLTSGDFAFLGAAAVSFAPKRGRTVFVLEGGYDFDALRVSTGAMLSAALDHPFRAEEPSAGGPGRDVIDRLRARQKGET